MPIPTNVDERPFFAPVGDLSVEVGSPLHVPIDGYDPEGGPLSVSVTIDDSSIASARVLTGNRSWRLDMEGYGDMVFELFEDRVDRPAGRIVELTQSGFYDDLTFHRVADGFVIQGGDPTATGTGGSGDDKEDGTPTTRLGDFDDQFHPELQHNRSGVLSFAKSSDDTNDSQFFITETNTRHLDYNHSIFGQLIEGEDVREAISRQAVDSNNKPVIPIRIDTATIFNDVENSIVLFEALGAGSTTATITITDEDGNSFSEVITVTTVAEGTVQSSNAQIRILTTFPILDRSATPVLRRCSSGRQTWRAIRFATPSPRAPGFRRRFRMLDWSRSPRTRVLLAKPQSGLTFRLSPVGLLMSSWFL